jgi:GH15 family glucan-1,4-alpha-glucosidase
MTLPIEDYAVVGEGHSMALVGRDGSIDWLCLPRFDSAACFAALVGDDRHGRWRVAPAGPVLRTSRQYRGDTMVLETTFETTDGVVRLVDFMPTRQDRPRIVRIVEGVRGRVPMRLTLCPRFDYGRTIPWVRHHDGTVTYTGGAHALVLHTDVPTVNDDAGTHAEFRVAPRSRTSLTLSWYPSWHAPPAPLDPLHSLAATEHDWLDWSARSTYQGE